MKFSAQEEYGLRCLLAIAKHGPNGSMTIPEIAQAEGITISHAAKLLAALRKGDFVVSTRGQSGGYQLSRTPDQIVIGKVMDELGGSLFDERFCARHSGAEDGPCVHHDGCDLHGLWARVQAAVDQVVFSITLQNLLDGALADGRSYARLGTPDSRPRPSDFDDVRFPR